MINLFASHLQTTAENTKMLDIKIINERWSDRGGRKKNSREHDAMWDFISPMKIDKHTATCMMAF